MSELSFLEKLLGGAEVSWLPLGDVTTIKTGQSVNKNVIANNPGDYPVINSGRDPLGFIDQWNTDNDPIGITTRGAGVGSITWQEGKYFRGNLNYAVTINGDANLETRYLYHLLLLMQSDIHALCTFQGIPALNSSNLKKLQIPIPCPYDPNKSLAIQAEIVRILDAFTALTAELTAELSARKKQYNYYRDQLLTFSDGEVEWKELGDKDYFDVGSGGTPSKSKPEYWNDGDVPWLKSESCNNEPVYKATNFISKLGLQKSSAKILPKDTTLIALVGATIFKTAYLEFEATTNQNIASIKSKNTRVINDKFVFYYITNLYEKLKSEMRNYGMLNLTTLRQFKIPMPSLEEQTRIVTILNKFDALTNSISEGLPREIELRQQQYEYYRDLLLNFPKPMEEAA